MYGPKEFVITNYSSHKVDKIILHFSKKLTELFRRLVIKYFQEKKLITEKFAKNLLSWKNSGFSVNNSIRIYGNDDKARESLSQYIAKPPVSLEKINYEPSQKKSII